MAPKLISCDMFGMLLKYWLSTGLVGGERVNPVGVLVSGGLPWHLMSGVVVGGDMTHSCDEVALCDVCCCAVCCVVVWAAAVNFGQFVAAAAAVVWAALLYWLMC